MSIILNEPDDTPPYIAIGKPKTMHMLNILVPMIFPTAISNSPFLADSTVIISSGKDVPITITVIAITFWLIPISLAKSTALSTTMSLAIIIASKLNIISIMDFFNVYFAFPLSSFLFFLTTINIYSMNIKKQQSNTIASCLERPFIAPFLNSESLIRKKKVDVMRASIGSSFFDVLSFTFIGFTMAAKPTISNMLTIELPITLAIVMSMFPVLMLLNDIASSGAHVPKDAIVSATSILGTFNFIDSELDASTKMSEYTTSTIRPIISNTIHVVIILILLAFFFHDI